MWLARHGHSRHARHGAKEQADRQKSIVHAAGAPEAEDGPRNEAWDEERVTDGAWRVNRRLQKEQRAGVHAAQPTHNGLRRGC